MGTGLFTPPAQALPEGLFYCYDDGNGNYSETLDLSDPAQAPTALCNLRDILPTENLSFYYDQSYPPPNSANYGSSFPAAPSLPVVVGEDIPSDSVNARWPNTTLFANPYYNHPNYPEAGSVAVDFSKFRRSSTPPSQGAENRIFWPEYVGTSHWYFKLESTPRLLRLTLPDSVSSQFVGVHLGVRNSPAPDLTLNISIKSDDNTRLETTFAYNRQALYERNGNTLPQPTPSWSQVGDMQTAHIANHPMGGTSGAWNDLQVYVLGLVLPTNKNITEIEFQIPETGTAWAGRLQNIFLFKAVKAASPLFPLPEGCVVPTPA